MFSFSWAGRTEAFKAIKTTAKGTLVPERNESIEFDDTENIFIEGDNLEVLKLLQKFMQKIHFLIKLGKRMLYRDIWKQMKNYLR